MMNSGDKQGSSSMVISVVPTIHVKANYGREAVGGCRRTNSRLSTILVAGGIGMELTELVANIL
jgi:hypothetical protein